MGICIFEKRLYSPKAYEDIKDIDYTPLYTRICLSAVGNKILFISDPDCGILQDDDLYVLNENQDYQDYEDEDED